MSNIRYAADKPKQCKFCYYWGGRDKGCELGEENCYYILPEKKKAKKTRPCDGCPYGRINPCIGYCLRNILQQKAKKGGTADGSNDKQAPGSI